MNRRKFITNSISGTSAVLFSSQLFALACSSKTQLPHLGIITNTVKKKMKTDWREAYRFLSKTGYNYIETGTGNIENFEEYNSFLKELNIRHIAGGASMANMLENFEKPLSELKRVGAEYWVCYWPWMDSAENITSDDVDKCIENAHFLGEQAKKFGLKFAIHNHDKEFQVIDNKRVFDLLIQGTDPDLVTFEMDIYWVVKGGGDPVQFFKDYPGRFELLHLKDLIDNEEKEKTCPGNGVLDFARYLSLSELAGTKYFIVENESCPEENQEACAIDSYNYLTSLKY